MSEEIKAGEYVRTENGKIGKIEYFEIDRNYDNPYCIRLENQGYGVLYEKMPKHSTNIIDLIEEGDYVNGQLIEKIDSKEQDKIFYEFLENEDGSYEAMGMCELKDIKSIVTHEQFAEMEYKVKE